MKLSSRERHLFIAAGIIVLFSLLYIAAVEPAFKKWDKDGALIKERTKRIQVLEKELSAERKINARHDAAMQQIRLDAHRKTTPQKLFAEMQALSEPCGVSIKDFVPLPIEKHKYRDDVAVHLDVESDLPSLVTFLTALNQQAGRLNVSRVAVAPVEPGNPTLKSRIQISTTILHEEANVNE